VGENATTEGVRKKSYNPGGVNAPRGSLTIPGAAADKKGGKKTNREKKEKKRSGKDAKLSHRRARVRPRARKKI